MSVELRPDRTARTYGGGRGQSAGRRQRSTIAPSVWLWLTNETTGRASEMAEKPHFYKPFQSVSAECTFPFAVFATVNIEIIECLLFRDALCVN